MAKFFRDPDRITQSDLDGLRRRCERNRRNWNFIGPIISVLCLVAIIWEIIYRA